MWDEGAFSTARLSSDVLSAAEVFFSKHLRVVGVTRKVLHLGIAFAVGGRAVVLAVSESDALALGNEVEVVVAHVHTFDLEALAMLPGVTHLQVAEPGVAV